MTTGKAVLTLMALSVAAWSDEKPHPYFQDCGEGKGASAACDVELIDQDGRPLRLYSDLLKRRTVVINAFFTTCKNSCPMMARNFAALQNLIGPRLGKDVLLLSFTVDPEADTPERLKAYAQNFQAKPGWLFLTGKQDNVNWALYKLGQQAERKEDHLNIFIVGNEARNQWQKVFGMDSPDRIMKVVRSVMNGGTP